MAFLPGYEAQISDSGVEHSIGKLDESAAALREYIQHDAIHTCPCASEEETLSYRCRCTFQLICSGNHDNQWEYAMRVKHKAIPINSTCFPIATPRIQSVMTTFIALIINENRQQEAKFGTFLSARPASISFAASWDGTDCTVTINYTDPLPEESTVEEKTWLSEADEIRRLCSLEGLTGQSKKRKLLSSSSTNGEQEIFIRDKISIKLSLTEKKHKTFDVAVGAPPAPAEGDACYSIFYKKPPAAFHHPNGNVMKTALKWILNRISTISRESRSETCGRIGLLEMYCGCGAHTLPLAKSGFVDFVAAVELDERLIKACQNNCRLNSIDAELSRNGKVAQNECPLVQLFHGDAGQWAKKLRHRQHKATASPKETNVSGTSTSWYDQDYSILLVDPPRAGLDNDICEMAIEGPFSHIIYVSCGKDALLRDLKVLDATFEVIDCTLIDLFPRTDAVESLVHLRRLIKD